MNEDHRLITTRSEFHDALREAFEEMARSGCREAWMCDEDFADWPLGDLGIIDSLTRWAMPHRKLTLVARHYDEVVRRYPRFVMWRRQYSHVIEARAQEEAEAGQIPTILLAPEVVCVRLTDPVRYRGALSRDVADAIRYREMIDAATQRSVESFPASILGL